MVRLGVLIDLENILLFVLPLDGPVAFPRRREAQGVRVPQRGKGVDRVELANRNARLSHESRFRKSQQDRLQVAAQKLGQILGYDREIARIESFDISNIQGSDSVAGMVSIDRGKFDKKQYRIFNIRTVEGADDFRSMAEAVEATPLVAKGY